MQNKQIQIFMNEFTMFVKLNSYKYIDNRLKRL